MDLLRGSPRSDRPLESVLLEEVLHTFAKADCERLPVTETRTSPRPHSRQGLVARHSHKASFLLGLLSCARHDLSNWIQTKFLVALDNILCIYLQDLQICHRSHWYLVHEVLNVFEKIR